MSSALSLCSGIGALDMAIQAIGVQTIGYCEYDPWCGEVLQHRMASGHLDSAPIWRDLKTLDGYGLPAGVDLIYGGIPCQPHSTAGSRKAAEDPRDLWPDSRRLLGEVRPRRFFLENVAGFATRNGDTPAFAYGVLADLAALGYVGRAGVVKASDAGAPHARARWFCLAQAGHDGGTEQEQLEEERAEVSRRGGVALDESKGQGREQGSGGNSRGTASSLTRSEQSSQVNGGLGNTDGRRRDWRKFSQGWGEEPGTFTGRASQFPPHRLSADWGGVPAEWHPAIESHLRGVVDGHSVELDENRRKRLAALGNAVVPAQVLLALENLL